MEAVADVEKQENPLEGIEMNELDPEHVWLFRYSLPCHRGNIDIFSDRMNSDTFKPLNHINESEVFNGDLSRYVVRDYFMGLHNALAFSAAQWDPKMFFHMLIPYKITHVNIDRRRKATESKIQGVVSKLFLGNYEEIPETLHSIELSKRQKSRMKKFDILDPAKLQPGDAIYVHAGLIVDFDKNGDEYEKPDPNIWKPFC